MLSYLTIWILLGYISFGDPVPWLQPSLEVLDELNDYEIYRAVVTSMDEWQRKQNLKKSHDRIKREDTTSVCYDELGCFEASGPFGYLDMLPSKPEEIDTKFLLYPGHSRRRSGSPPAEVPFTSLKEAFVWAKQGFNATLPTKVLIHGFGSGCSHIWIYEMRSALMAVEEVNVICVDWENGAILPNYVKATANTRLVGKQLSMLLRGLIENNGLSLRNTHLIGFSLGAHVAGFAGAEFEGNLSRITGLDPAGPLFESQDPRARLDQTDAGFVDVIHSNGENLILGGLGSYQPMGHVDFYPNGGRMQKGCSNLFVGAVSDIIWSSAIEGRSLCNHRRAYKFFTDSVSPRCHFPAFPCDSYEDFLSGKCFPCTDERNDGSRICGNMGYYADRSKGRGQLYLITRDEEPFCAHQYHVKIETSPSLVPITSYGKIQITLIGDSGLNETFMLTRKEDDEMKLGESIARILVPHPILSEPTRIEILYTAYSGWLSSGLTQWRIDKVTLSDSFGKILSVCKKNLVLDSGIPVVLQLYPGECDNLTSTTDKEAQDRNIIETGNFIKPMWNVSKEYETNSFNPTPVVRIGDDFKNISDDHLEAESSRAFNTRLVKIDKTTNGNDNDDGGGGFIREIVEPILKPHSNKSGRSHDVNRNNNNNKSEISEPILGPTTLKNFGAFKIENDVKNEFLSRINKNNKEISYNFYDVDEQNQWPSSSSSAAAANDQVVQLNDKKWKRQDNRNNDNVDNPLEVIAMTVQVLPQRLARMFEQAEKYARETILPLVSTYTPRFISDFITPKKETPKYLPLSYEQTTTIITTLTTTTTTTTIKPTTTRSHIQKIKKKFDKNKENEITTSRKARDDVFARKNILDLNFEPITKELIQTTSEKGIYIDLPVFDSNPQKIKYIPLA